jgi:hypothetical protein
MKTHVVAGFVSLLAVGPMLLNANRSVIMFPSVTGLRRCIGNQITQLPTFGLVRRR